MPTKNPGTSESRAPSRSSLVLIVALGLIGVPLAFGLNDDGDNLENLPPANDGAFEGSSLADVEANGFVDEDDLQSGGFDVPTGGPPSPLFGAQSFEQKMLRFEEFGTEPLPDQFMAGDAFPPPMDLKSGPDGGALDDFLAQPIYPEPTRLSNDIDLNPWQPEIEDFVGRPLNTPPAEGRPPGEGWAHQRYGEFPPDVWAVTAQAGSRVNGGLRDHEQMHGYNEGEFAPGGLYHNTTGLPGFEGTTEGITIRFHPDLPDQDPETLWTFDGTLPPKLLMARYGKPIVFRHYNALAIDPSANRGFGLHTISTHEHNGHNPAESDGYTNAFFFPGQFYDYGWPMILAGHDSINTGATDPKAGSPDGNGGITQIPGDHRETMSTHWFHDHMLSFTAQNVYKGNAAMMNYYSALDRGNEGLEDGVNLRFPSGTELDWGNRDYDVNLLIASKAWDTTGQLWFNIFNLDGFIGDQILTNWQYHPYLDVRARQYRFRILNGDVSRYIQIALVKVVDGSGGQMPGAPGSGVSYDRVPFYMIADDGNIMEHAIRFDGTEGTFDSQLPLQAIGERFDIIVDFSQFQPGDKLRMVNVTEHKTGKRPEMVVPLRDILSGEYKAVIDGDEWDDGDPAVQQFLEFRVQPYSGDDQSMDPADYVPGKKKMIPVPRPSQEELDNALHRTFSFGRSSGIDSAPWTIKTDGGAGIFMDPRRLSAAPSLGADGLGVLEIWHIENGGGGWSHPVHVHFEEGIILSRGGEPPPIWEQYGRKDMYRVGNKAGGIDDVEIAIRFREFAGTYMEHCHNTQHEDSAMLLRWDIERPGQIKLLPAPIPTWDGVQYVETVALPTFRTGDGVGPEEPVFLLPSAAWGSMGSALAGTSGTPSLTIGGETAAGGTSTFSLGNIPANTPAYFVVGLQQLNEPMFGGNLVPAPWGLLKTFQSNGSGQVSFDVNFPANTPPGVEIYVQFWVKDAGAPFGYSASNAFHATTR